MLAVQHFNNTYWPVKKNQDHLVMNIIHGGGGGGFTGNPPKNLYLYCYTYTINNSIEIQSQL